MSAVFQRWDQDADSYVLPPCCPACESLLQLHQPDDSMPDRLLATCSECKSWYLTNADSFKLAPIRLLASEVSLEDQL